MPVRAAAALVFDLAKLGAQRRGLSIRGLILAWARFVHNERLLMQRMPVVQCNRLERLGVVRHFDECKTLGAPGVAIRNHARAYDVPGASEELSQIVARDLSIQIPDV